MKRKRVLVGLSGGLDSTISALLLTREGYDVIGIHLKLWTDDKAPSLTKNLPENKCCSVRDLMLARGVAKKLNMPFYVIDFREKFKKAVVDEFLEGFNMGITPNPCVECNRTVKFGFFLEKMKDLSADFVATGHYSRNEWNPKRKMWELMRGCDDTKDQSYFLYNLSQEKLAHVLFPLGNFTKQKVREIARKNGFQEFVEKRESQGVCFYPETQYFPFLERHLPKSLFQKGSIVLKKNGQHIGEHEGLPRYTVGQRAKVGGMICPLYVLGSDLSKNILYVGENEELFVDELHLKKVSFIGEELEEGSPIEIRIRHGGKPERAHIFGKNDERLIKFDKKIRAITPGQSAVFSRGELILGGGVIV
ncbi:tRNA 2-thiouridine(34) synthase MnmA [Candidatus Peregrinibacteria bacterium]|nr:tRNA 2-thiouridine(34) synthase MnmA [Candidatus Peregrinibacteria bacterium]